MKQISNWIFGSFFRTIGRLLVFIVLGIIVAHFIDFGSIIDNFSITNLFFDKIDALSIYSNVEYLNADYFSVSNTSGLTEDGRAYFYTISKNANIQTQWFNFSNALSTSNADYVTFGIEFGIPTQQTTSYTTTNDQIQCRKWYCTAYTGSACDKWQCESNGWYVVSEDTDKDYIITDYEFNKLNINAYVTYADNSWLSCSWQENELICPANRKNITSLRLDVLYDTQRDSTIKIGVQRGWKKYKITNIQGAIESQTQQQQQQHQETQSYLEDSNTTQAENDASNFFSGFSVNLGGLTGIITAPLNTIQSLLNSSCTNLVLPLPFVNKNLTLPCMNDIYTEHFGLFFSLYQTIILGIIAYRCIMSIFFDIKGFTNPDDDRIEVMDL